jgi:hypothetical protein
LAADFRYKEQEQKTAFHIGKAVFCSMWAFMSEIGQMRAQVQCNSVDGRLRPHRLSSLRAATRCGQRWWSVKFDGTALKRSSVAKTGMILQWTLN